MTGLEIFCICWWSLNALLSFYYAGQGGKTYTGTELGGAGFVSVLLVLGVVLLA